ncbi:Rne/Rng family ribonuclease, partial [bacterium]|nr:Rne/Rng family ribonuclease [bacterium]
LQLIDADDTSTDTPSISSLLAEGQNIFVQVVKDPIGSKGARVTSYLSVSSRHLVYMAHSEHIGVSQRIDNAEERDRLREILADSLASEQAGDVLSGGFIIRTAAEGIVEDDMRADIRYLKRLWQALQKKMATRNAPDIIYEELHLCERTMRDLLHPAIEKVRVDDSQMLDKLRRFVQEFIPDLPLSLEYYDSDRPIFDLFGVEDEIARALGRKVELKSGGYLIFDQTEAMTTIDVNTGGFVGKRNLEETILKTNLEAATALARQLRIRNLGGIIIIDFIDMKDEEYQRRVLRALEKAMENDRAKVTLTGVTELGLVQMTRKRTRESLEHVLCEPCGVCSGRGTVRSPETVCSEIFREIIREARAYDNDSLLVLASQAVVDLLLDEYATVVSDLEGSINKSIQFQVEPIYSQEQYDVVLL